MVKKKRIVDQQVINILNHKYKIENIVSNLNSKNLNRDEMRCMSTRS